MMVNREKILAILSLLILLAGLYRVTVAVITPAPDIEVRDIALPQPASRDPGRVRYSVFAGGGPPSRNPFSFSEGWSRLETLPLALPPLTSPARLLPYIGVVGAGPSGRIGFFHEEGVPLARKKDDVTEEAEK